MTWQRGTRPPPPPRIPRWALYGGTCAVTVVVTAWVQLANQRDVVTLAEPRLPPRNIMAAASPGVPTPPTPPTPQTPHPFAAALPFSYLGHWAEGATTRVLLRRGDVVVTVRGVGKLDADYAVDSIAAGHIVLRHVLTGQTHALALQMSNKTPAGMSPVVGANGFAQAAPEAPADPDSASAGN